MASNKITYNRGTSSTYGVTYSNQNGVDGAQLFFTVKEDVDSNTTDTTALVKKTVAMVGNAATISLAPTDIAPTWDEGDYVYDIKVEDDNGNIYLVVEGVFALNASATNRTS